MADILLKDRDGTPVAMEGVDKGINVLLTNGTEKIYVDSDEVPEPVTKAVELDFSESDSMTITPEEGQVFSSIVIPKPPNLIPENIPKDLDIAGIIGAMAAGGGGNIKVTSGGISGKTTPVTVEHGLGMKPDVFFICCTTNYSSISSNKVIAGVYYAPGVVYPSQGQTAAIVTSNRIISTLNDNVNAYLSVDETTATLGTSGYPGVNSAGYVWIAIGGLT